MKNLNWKMIGLGIVVDFVLSIILGGLLAVGLVIIQAAQAAPVDIDNLEEKLNSLSGLWVQLITGLLATFVGGYVAAGRSESRNAVLQQSVAFTIFTVCIWLILENLMQMDYPLWYSVVSSLAIFPVSYCGGLFRWHRKLKAENRVLDTLQPPIPLP